MQNNRNVGLAVVGLGLLLACFLCPLVLDILTLLSSGRAGIYDQLFSARLGNFSLSTFIVGAQLTCSCLLALILLAIGIAVVVRERESARTPRIGA